MTSWVLVNYSSTEKLETFFVSEYEEKHKKIKSFRVFRALISYIPLVIKFLA